MSSTEQQEKIKFYAQRGKRLGMGVSQRREYVIDLLSPDITKVPLETRLTAINKYFEVIEKGKNTSTFIEVAHPKKELNIRKIAEGVSNKLECTLIVSKKDGDFVNINNPWWMGKGKKERARSARAALYFVYNKLFSEFGILDKDSKLNQKCYRLSLIGIDEKKPFDITIATNYDPSDRTKLKRMKEIIEAELGVSVTLAGKNDDNSEEAIDYSGYSSISVFRKEPSAKKDKHHPAFGAKHNTFQIGINRNLRDSDEKVARLVNVLSVALQEIQNEQ
jgi:hypothetical protein